MTERASDRHRERLEALGAAILDGPGVLETGVRGSAAKNDGVPAAFEAFVKTIHRQAYRVTDEDVAALRSAGADQDQIFEIVISAAYGAALERVQAGLNAVREIEDAT